MNKIDIKRITADETYPLRHAILRYGKPLETCFFDGDNLDTTKHFGAFKDSKLVGVVSYYEQALKNIVIPSEILTHCHPERNEAQRSAVEGPPDACMHLTIAKPTKELGGPSTPLRYGRDGNVLQIQLRGMAIDNNYQHQGIGKLLVEKTIPQLASHKESLLIWCNAREHAVSFYERLGFETIGERFWIDDAGFHYVMIKK